MLQSRIRTQEEQAAYMKELKSWLAEAREIPAEGSFFKKDTLRPFSPLPPPDFAVY